MKRFLNWKIIAIILFALILGYIDLPDRYQTIPGTPDAIQKSKIHLGLDLQGGIQLDYKIDLRKVAEEDQKQILEGVREVINRRVNGLGVSEPNIYLSEIAGEHHIIVELAGIKDVEQAKKTVGKTIQLEFKEEKGPSDDKTFLFLTEREARAVYQKIRLQPEQLGVIGQEESLAQPNRVFYETTEFETKKEIIDSKFADALFNAAPGALIPFQEETLLGFIQTGDPENPQAIPFNGFTIAKVLEKREGEREEKKPREVKASHILIAYKGASRASEQITRSTDEAEKLAEEILRKIEEEKLTFEDAAKKYSDEPGASDTAGKLDTPVKEGGIYAQAFTTAALKIKEVRKLSKVTETEFGFHIIRADNITEESVTKISEPEVKYEYIFFSKLPDPWQDTGLTGEHFKKAEVQFDQLYQPYIAIKFNDEGGKLFEEITERNVGKQVAIFVGGALISNPRVNTKISGGEAIITGVFTIQEAQALARDLNTGAIPAPIVLTGQYSIGATLGQEALTKSIWAGIIGILVIIVFMIFYYRLPGLIASIALGVYSILFIFLLKASLPLIVALAIAVLIFLGIVYAILQSQEDGWEKLVGFVIALFALFFLTFLLSAPVVLTLAGVAGVILSIGMAVDANILIFERTKEELQAGRPLSAAIEIGFDRAWSSIRDSNFSSLITTSILFYFGTSIIQGFALTLAAGILISMFTAITVTRNLLMILVPTKLASRLWLFGKTETKERKTYNFVGKYRLWFSVSGIVIVAGIIALLFSGLKFGLDFEGGSLLDIKFNQPVAVETLKGKVGEMFSSVSIVPSEENRSIIRTEHMDETTHTKLIESLEKSFGSLEEIRFTTVGPTVGETLKRRAFVAVLIALVAIVLYIAFAFRKIPKKFNAWKFGICAIIALAHDVFIPIGIFALLNVEIDAFFITALLTILGFSVHDTIVVFDRIRERLNISHEGDFRDIANKALRETMARSINTSFTTLLTLLALLFFGSSSIFYFTLALVIGIFVGTYSSIFIATPLLVLWQKK